MVKAGMSLLKNRRFFGFKMDGLGFKASVPSVLETIARQIFNDGLDFKHCPEVVAAV